MKTELFSAEEFVYFLTQYHLYDYHLNFFNSSYNYFSFKNKIVLEIGGSNIPHELIFEKLQSKKWVCLDMPWEIHLNSWKEHYKQIKTINFSPDLDIKEILNNDDYIIIIGTAENIPESFYNFFDICISNCCFEHVNNLISVINNIYNSLNKTGKLYSKFAPIFSAKYGSHFWINDNFNFINSNLPFFPHLLLSMEEINRYILENKYKLEQQNNVYYAEIIKNGYGINRLFYEDYEFILKNSYFNKYIINGYDTYYVDEYIIDILQKKYSPYKKFNFWGLEIFAEK